MDPLLTLYEEGKSYAVVLMSGNIVQFWLVSHNYEKLIKKIEEDLPNKQKKGGQSAPRFGRIHDEKIMWYTKKIAEIMVQLYTKEGLITVEGVIIGGPAEIKTKVIETDLFQQYLKNHLIKVIDTAEITDTLIHDVKKQIQLELDFKTDQKDFIKEVDELIADINVLDKIVFGKSEVIQLFESGQLEKIYVFKEEFVEKMLGSKTNVIIVNDPLFLKKYGGIIGIKYY